MSNQYIIGIDETGKFDKQSKKEAKEKASMVGGVVLKNPRNPIVRNCLEGIKNQWNQGHPNSQLQRIEQFHYFPLRGIKWSDSGQESPVSKEEGVTLTNAVVKALSSLEDLALVFSSSGFPPFFVNEQQAYVEILRTTLWGLFSDKLGLEEGDSVYVLVAPRAQAQGAFSVWRPVDYNFYYQFIMDQLNREFSEFAQQKKITLKLESNVKLVLQTPEVIAADFFLGNERTGGVPEVKYCRIRFQDYYLLALGINPVDEIVKSYESGNCTPITAFSRLLQLYALECLKDKETAKPILTRLKKILKDMVQNELEMDELVSLLDKTLENLLTTRAESEENMKIAEIYCQSLLNLYPVEENQENQSVLRLQEVLMRHQIGIESHKGSVVNQVGPYIETYRTFFAAHKQELYPTIGERLLHQLDMELKAVQVSHFNNYNFAEVERILDPHYKKYKETYRKFLATKEKDATFGKLCGTLGQANAFLYAIHKSESVYYEMAAEQLQDDTNNFMPPTQMWSIGMHFRIQLELCRQDNPDHYGDKIPWKEALELMRILWDNQKLSPNSLLTWGIKNGSPWDLALILKFMGYYQHYNPSFTTPPDQLQNTIEYAASKNWPWYPACHIWKWALYLAVVSKNQTLVENALGMVQPCPEDDFTLKTLEIPLLMWHCFIKSKSPKPVLQKFEDLLAIQPFFKDCMGHAQWQAKFPAQTSKEWDVWNIVTLLPFYYG